MLERTRRTEVPTIRLTFDFPDASGRPSRRIYDDPSEVVTATSLSDVLPALGRVDEAVRKGLHAAGYLAYEAAPALDPAMEVGKGNRMPLLCIGVFERFEAPAAGAPPPGPRPGSARLSALEIATSKPAFVRAVARIREAIAEGRTYQVNYSTRVRGRLEGDARALYDRLRRAQGDGLHAFLELEDFWILSASPELFFSRSGDVVTARPMKGTRPRGRWPEEDRDLADQLRGSEKDRAENRMIVDLLRNDIGRISRYGTVRVSDVHRVETFRTVLQMTSTVTGRLLEDVGWVDVVGALFPCGSVTGAPKVSTMRMIAETETSPREVYCGAIGYVEPGGDCTFNVPIRTLWIDRRTGRWEYGTGAGITWDSAADEEYEEVRAKAAVLTEEWPAFEVFETMRLEDGRVRRLERHLARLAGSCAYFGFPASPEAVRRAVREAMEHHRSAPCAMRVYVDERGSVRITPGPLPSGARDPAPVALASGPVDSGNRFLYHKTTHRDVYERHVQAHPRAFDVLLWNERDEATEFTRGNLVLERNGCRVTPPRDSGLLAGTFRAELLEAGAVKEAIVPVSEITPDTHMWLVNSLREWVPVRLALLCVLALLGVVSGCARGGPEPEEVYAPPAGGTAVPAYAHLEDEVAHLLDFLQGKVPLREDLLSDSVTLYLAEEGGGAERSLAREDLRSPSAWRVGDYAFAPPEGYGHRMITPGRHWNCLPVALGSRRSGLAHLPHVGVRLSGDVAASCLQTWNATFVFDADVGSPRLTGVVHDQWEW